MMTMSRLRWMMKKGGLLNLYEFIKNARYFNFDKFVNEIIGCTTIKKKICSTCLAATILRPHHFQRKM